MPLIWLKEKENKLIQYFWSYLFKYEPDTVVGAGNKDKSMSDLMELVIQ